MLKILAAAKSNVVNSNSATPDNPPQLGSIRYLEDLTAGEPTLESQVADMETFIRNQAALGDCAYPLSPQRISRSI